MSDKITVEVIYNFVTSSGSDKRVFLRKKNMPCKKSEDQLMEVQDFAKEYTDSNYCVDLDCNGRMGDSGQMIYIMEIVTPFDSKEEGSQIAHEIMDMFCEKAET